MSTTATTNLSMEPLQVSTVDVNWSDLPAEMLQCISKMLQDICDFLNFRIVFKSWHASTPISSFSPGAPWLLISNDNGRLCFYSIVSDKILTVRCPQSRGRAICGPARGYLYTVEYVPGGRWKHMLLNPITKHEVILRLRESAEEPRLMSMPLNYIGDDDYMAFLNLDDSRMEFYQPHRPDERYYAGGRACPLRDTDDGHLLTGDACLKGMHFLHHRITCETEVFNIARGHLFVIPPPEMHGERDKVAFVESSEGEILRIVKHGKSNTYVFHIYQLVVEDETRHRYRWVKIRGIGDNVLFLDYFWLVSGMSAKSSIGLRGNCIYDIEHPDPNDDSGWEPRVYRYDIEDGRSHRIPCPCRYFWTWFAPSFVSLLPPN